MLLDVVVLFFVLGIAIQLLKVKLRFPEGLARSLMLILLIAIGLKGGISLQSHGSISLLWQAAIVAAIGLILPLVAFPLLRYFGEFNPTNAASIAAHYGSVSVGTYAVALAVLESNGVAYEGFFPLFVVVLEMPAIAVGILLASSAQKSQSTLPKIAHEMVLNPGVALMLGGLLVGYFANNSVQKIMPLFGDLFTAVLALFLLDMGMIAAKKVKDLSEHALFLVAFSIFMPLVGALLGAGVGHYVLGFSTGGVALLAVLSASASYIAVPAAMREALPEANHSLSIAASLGVTFPFNVLVGIPLYLLLAQWLTQS
ncbi:hypothetical protein SAMN02745866_00926 [Alteromonadaceae bacterium Bs31]|nr:hypothetical protein SAMN02745866_00926 [Alteromonadaceae bacterium Bs31]